MNQQRQKTPNQKQTTIQHDRQRNTMNVNSVHNKLLQKSKVITPRDKITEQQNNKLLTQLLQTS